MEVIFPIGELIDGELTMVDVVVSILFEGSVITWDGSQRIDVLHSEQSIVDMPEGFIASGSWSTELSGSHKRTLDIGFISSIAI